MTVLVAILLAPFAILTTFFAAEILLGLRAGRPESGTVSDNSAVIVIPAHDEAEVIGKTLQSL